MVDRARAAVMVRPGLIEVREFPVPALEDGAILLRVDMCGICGTDKHTWRGESRQYAGTAAESDTPYPIIPGHEIVGTAVEVNDRSGPRLDFDGQPVRVGDRLALCPDVICGTCYACRHTYAYPWCENLRGYGNAFTCTEAPYLLGGWAEYLYVLPKAFVYHVPDELPDHIAVMAELMAVSYNLDKLKEFYTLAGEGMATGDTVVVQGAGPMGICHIIKARMLGAGMLIATDISDYRLGLATEFGADCTLNVTQSSPQERIDQVRSLTHGRGADVVVECVGRAEVVVEGLEMLRKGGSYIEAGNFVETGDITLSPHRHLCAKNVRLFGMTNHPFTGYTPSMQMLVRTARQFPYDKFVSHVYPLARTPDAMLRALEPDTLKVVVAPWEAQASGVGA